MATQIMQSRALTIEDGKEPSALPKTTQSRVSPLRILQFFGLFLVLGLGFSVISMFMIRYWGVPNAVNAAMSEYTPCLDESGILERWIRPPSNLMHSMTDKELFWRASLVPQVSEYPFTRVPKIAFMFLTRGPLPLSPIWEKFLSGHEGLYSIYVHSLPSYEAKYPSSSIFYRRQIPSQVSEWGRMSMCDAERRLLANALLDVSNERFVLVSESCIPVFNFSIVYDYLLRSRYSFVGAFDDPGPYGRGRYNPNMAPEVNIMQWRKGSQWFEVNRRLAIQIVVDNKFYPKFEEFCRPACYVDEHYFPTMLSIQAPHLLANTSLTWVDWSRGGAHPATFGKSDITEGFLKRIVEGQSCLYNDHPSTVCFLFARKFSPSALEPLLQQAPKIFAY